MKPYNETAQTFADAMAALIEHPDCPERVYKALTDFSTELADDLGPAWTAHDEAEAIRRNFPSLLVLAARLEASGGEQ